MNEEKYILARLKASIIVCYTKSEDPVETATYEKVLHTIALYEAESVIGDIIDLERAVK